MDKGLNKLSEIWNAQLLKEQGFEQPRITNKDVFEALGHVFCPGPFYFYVFDFSRLELMYMHPNVEQVLGYDKDDLSFESLGSYLHPDDMLHMQRCEQIALDFLFNRLPPEEIIKNYKVSYCIRIKRLDGTYANILHQAIALSLDDNGHITAALGVHSDISHYSSHHRTMSIISLKEGFSYWGIDPEKGMDAMNPPPALLSDREIEILRYLSEGNTVKEVSQKLFLSEHTVRTHRNNIRQKLNSRNTVQMVAKAIRYGLI